MWLRNDHFFFRVREKSGKFCVCVYALCLAAAALIRTFSSGAIPRRMQIFLTRGQPNKIQGNTRKNNWIGLIAANKNPLQQDVCSKLISFYTTKSCFFLVSILALNCWKITQNVAFEFLNISILTLFDCKLQVFKKNPLKCGIFGIFNALNM